jgi:hypothetical protein
MRHPLTGCVALGLALVWLVSPFPRGEVRAVPAKGKGKIIFLDLKSKANHKLKDDFHSSDFAGNNLAELPRGEKKFAGVKFKVGDGLLQLGSTQVQGKPDKIEGIAVGETFTKLHILHATGYQEEDGTAIGSYVVHYADKSKATIEIVYGKDVRDWWDAQDKGDTKRGKLAWEGVNAPVKERNGKVRLYLTTWTNPHPKKKVVSIDYTSAKTKCAPFCVAMTLEAK